MCIHFFGTPGICVPLWIPMDFFFQLYSNIEVILIKQHICFQHGTIYVILLVFYCSITNYQKFNSLKQDSFIISQFPWLGSWAWLSWVLYSGSQRLQSRCWAVLENHRKLRLPLQAHAVVGGMYFDTVVKCMKACFFKARRRKSFDF